MDWRKSIDQGQQADGLTYVLVDCLLRYFVLQQHGQDVGRRKAADRPCGHCLYHSSLYRWIDCPLRGQVGVVQLQAQRARTGPVATTQTILWGSGSLFF